MKNKLLEILYNQILFYSDQGKSIIENPNFVVQETHKISSETRKEVISLFKELNEIGFIEKVSGEKTAYRIKSMISIQELNRLLLKFK